MENLKENDIYKVTEFTEQYRNNTFEPRHCFEGIFIVKKENDDFIFSDTFWGIGDMSGKCFKSDDVDNNFKVKYCGNLDDYQKSDVYEPEKYYLESDILILSRQHACHVNCIYTFIKKDAKRDKGVMIESIKRKIEKTKQSIRNEQSSLSQYEEKINEVENGDLSIYI